MEDARKQKNIQESLICTEQQDAAIQYCGLSFIFHLELACVTSAG
jgi:hypothetical protein